MNMELDRRTAVQLVQQLRAGVPKAAPSTIRFIHVGREKWLDGMDWDLRNAVEADATGLRSLKGYYGDGKSHFLFMTMWRALERNMVVSYISAEKSGLKKFDFELLWKSFVKNLGTPESGGEAEGIGGLLDRWAERIPDVSATLRELNKLRGVEPDFRNAVRGYLEAYFGDADRTPFEQWFQGEAVRPKDVKERIDQRNCSFMLRSLALFLKHIGYGGILLVMDELELIQDQTKKVRDTAYESLRQLVDNPFAIPGYVFVGAATPEMFTSPRGFQEYSALYQRMGAAFGLQAPGEEINYRGVVIDLERTPLTASELEEIARKIRHIFSVAEEWDGETAVPDTAISTLIRFVQSQAADLSLPRWIVATMVDLLMKKQQNPSYDLLARIPEEARAAADRIREAERQRHRKLSE